MKSSLPLLRNVTLVFALALAWGSAQAQSVSMKVYASGFNNPRGLKFGPNGNLYVAEGGTGGTHSTVGKCRQVEPPIGPYTGSLTGGRVSVVERVAGNPVRRTLTTDIPSSQTAADSGSLVSGAADVAFIGNTLYVLVGGGGCSHGTTRNNVILRVSPSGAVTSVANLSAYILANPGSVVEEDFEPDGTWYSMVAYNGALYVVEPNQGLFLRVNPTTGAITRVLDIAGSLGEHVVPTALARHGGYFYISNLGPFPIVDGSERVWRVLSNPTRLQVVARGTTILGIAFDSHDALYLLQTSSGAPEPTPGMGSIVRIRPGGGPHTIVSGLTLPTAMTFGPDGALYVSHIGFGPPIPGLGEILRIDVGN
jgi:hypothetical protein